MSIIFNNNNKLRISKTIKSDPNRIKKEAKMIIIDKNQLKLFMKFFKTTDGSRETCILL